MNVLMSFLLDGSGLPSQSI